MSSETEAARAEKHKINLEDIEVPKKKSRPDKCELYDPESPVEDFVTNVPIKPVKMQLKPQKPKEAQDVVLEKPSKTISQSDEEEMPVEARIRMRNKGRNTPTSSGPNSFGKGKFGFLNHSMLIERQNDAMLKTLGEEDE
ncbi:hypothetical protein Ciccas_004071 [Cichlidogyrus casuarinus]|uniref:PEST proteolytic signal-containing nuclear protein n=1 Tax=Cichlidogyrus casuarinus TaxID=1844966 RepID=A0ABD2QCJ1_9PLAT